jgi:hypothetical protein
MARPIGQIGESATGRAGANFRQTTEETTEREEQP